LNLTVDTRSPSSEVCVVTLEGEIDVYTSIQLKQDIATILAEGQKYVVLNVSKVEYLDSTGLGVLIGTLKRLRETGGNLVIVGPAPRITRIFEITGLYKIFAIYATEEEASIQEGIAL
jgi:anti-sigma B factor antagonist